MLIFRCAVDACDGISLVEITLARKQIQIISRLHGHRLSANSSVLLLDVDLNLRPEALFIGHGQQAHIRLIEAAHHLIGEHGNLLDQTHVIRIHRRQAIQHIDLLAMCGRITQDAHGIERSNRFLGFRRIIDALRFIDDNDRVRILNEAHGRLAAEPVLRLIDDVFRLLERVDIDDHDLNIRAGRKLADVGKLRRLIDKEPAGHVIILKAEMLSCDLKGFMNTLANRHRRHNDDELREPILPVKLEDRLRIDIGLAGARLHLDAKLRRRSRSNPCRKLKRKPGSLPICFSQRQLIALLNRVHILFQRIIVNDERIAHARIIQKIRLVFRFHGERAARLLLTGKQIDHRIHGVGLEVLVLKLKLH